MSVATLRGDGSEAGPVKRDQLTANQRLLVGGLGGVTPIIATMMAGGYETLPLPDYQGLLDFYFGFSLRITLFFCVGAVFVWLHQEVRGRYAVFRLGVTAPALIAAMIGASPAEAADDRVARAFGSGEIRVAALSQPQAAMTLSDALPVEVVYRTKRCSILDGFLGRKCKTRSDDGQGR